MFDESVRHQESAGFWRDTQAVSEVDSDRETDRDVGIRMALLNTRSLNDKKDRIRQLITRNKVDVFLSTETWLDWHGEDAVLAEASPENFSFFHEARFERGGGVAIQYSEVFQCRKIGLNCRETFECVAMELQHDEWDTHILLINMYRPPKPNHVLFLNEFKNLLHEIIRRYDNIILTGDFNIHVDEAWRSSASNFCSLLQESGFDQHVDQPTHKNGHTLDLVITKNVDISNLSVQDDGISDHYTVLFNAMPFQKG